MNELKVWECKQHNKIFESQQGYAGHLKHKEHQESQAVLNVNISPEEWVLFLNKLIDERNTWQKLAEEAVKELGKLKTELESANKVIKQLETTNKQQQLIKLDNEQALIYQDYAKGR